MEDRIFREISKRIKIFNKVPLYTDKNIYYFKDPSLFPVEPFDLFKCSNEKVKYT